MPELSGVRLERNWTSPVGALGGLLAAAGRPIDQVDLMGLTGHAFRLNIDILLTIMGPWDLPWHDLLPLWERLGAVFQVTRARATDRHYVESRHTAWERITAAIDRGWPVIAYDLLGLPEYGLITGYSAEPPRLAGVTLNEPEQPAWQPFAAWPRPDEPQATKLEIITLVGLGVEPERSDLEVQALRTATELPYLPGSRDGWTQNGWLAYQHWAAVLGLPEDHAPDGGLGHAYNLMVVQRARRDAALFLARLAERHPRAQTPLRAAQAAYEAVRDLFTEATQLIAFPEAAGARDPGTRRAVADLLRQAAAKERQGVDLIEQALRAL